VSNGDIIVSLDIGTSKVRAVIGEINSDNSINIIGVGTADSEGIRKGAIVDIDQTVLSIKNAIEHAERMVDIEISEVYVGIQGSHIGVQTNHGVVAVSNEDREIGEEDIERVLQAAKVVTLPPDREIINLVPKQYIVDGLEGISDPRGMIGVRLEVEATVITGAKSAVHNLVRCVDKAGLKINGVILLTLASGVMTLSKDEKEAGTALVDIGGGSTTIAIYEQGGITAISSLPIGGQFVTNDIAYGLRSQSDHAEKIKLKFGCANIEDAADEVRFKVTRMGSNVEKEFSQKDLASIIEPRMQEIFQLIKAEVTALGYGDKVDSYVLTGGSVSLPGTLTLAQAELDASVRIALPDFIGVKDPSYSSGVGMIQYVSKYMGVRGASTTTKKPVSRKGNNPASSKPRMLERIKNMFQEFI